MCSIASVWLFFVLLSCFVIVSDSLDPPENITIRLIPNSNILNGTLEVVCSADGNPAPRSFRWFMDGKFIKNTTGSLKIFSLKYTDGGTYSCAPEQLNFTQNNLTRKSIFVVIKGPPSHPLDVSSIPAVRSKNSLGISWKPPKYNGNETIDLYQVKYTTVDSELIIKNNPTSLNFTAHGLLSDTKYSFMVRAMNKLFGPGPWSEQTVSDFTKPDDSQPTMLRVIRVNYTNVMRATWKEPLEIISSDKYLYELCYEEDGVNSATLKCYNTSELTWQTEPLKEYKIYLFKVRSCIKEEKRCSPFTTNKEEKTGPKPPEKPFGLDAKRLSPTELNITWKTKIPYHAYHVKHGTMQSNLQKVILTRKFYVLSKLEPNTNYIVQVYAEKITKNDNRKVIGEATMKIFTTAADPNDVDQCSPTLKLHDCHKYADCTNAIGSFTCTCKEGFEGDGKTCEAFLPKVLASKEKSNNDKIIGLTIGLTVMVVVIIVLIGLAVRYVRSRQKRSSNTELPLTKLAGSAEENRVQWKQTSTKHRPKFEELLKIAEKEPSAVTIIGIYRVCFKPEFVIGYGNSGTVVYIGLSDDGIEVAVKSIPINICKELGENEKEILNCPSVRKESHIVNYRFYTDSVDSRHGYLVLDLHEENLKDYVLKRSKEELTSDGPRIIREVFCGLKALHCGKEQILHRDLKPANILVSLQGEMILSDFGISRKLRKGQTTHQSGEKGTDDWIAVESLLSDVDDNDDSPNKQTEKQVRYKKQSDIQVIGMLLFYILSKGGHPYGKRVYRKVNLLEGKPVNLGKLDDPVAKDLMGWMLQHDPKNRPSVQQCLQHPYLLTTDEQFNLVTRVGNEREIKINDGSSVVVKELNADPSLPKPSWKPKIDPEVLRYASSHRRHRPYSDSMADLLRLIRNTAVHWNDKPPPTTVQAKVGNPKKYFLKLFPTLPVVLHRIIRNESDWNQREQLKQFFL